MPSSLAVPMAAFPAPRENSSCCRCHGNWLLRPAESGDLIKVWWQRINSAGGCRRAKANRKTKSHVELRSRAWTFVSIFSIYLEEVFSFSFPKRQLVNAAIVAACCLPCAAQDRDGDKYWQAEHLIESELANGHTTSGAPCYVVFVGV